jgi:crotonobetainyl-CoA:carnitine CoA-transferase CaiB-like acyl-CoA transferase
LRLEHREALRHEIEALLATKPARWWQLKLNKAGVPNGMLTRFPELMYHPQTRDNGYMYEIDTPHWGRLFTGGLPWTFSRTPAVLEPARMLGEDTSDVFDEAESLPEPLVQGPASASNGRQYQDNRPPLDGLKVIEIAQGIAGPYAGMELADAGADVIKVEHLSGDLAREWEPRGATGLGAAFLQLNRGKRSVVLDLTSEDGGSALRELIATSDVVIEDADFTREHGIDVSGLMANYPRIVHNRISGWGPHGPWADLPATEIGAQLASEVTMSLGKFGERPVRVGTDLASTYAGLYGFQGILAALYRRERDGLGQRVDVSLFGCLVTMRSIMWAALSNPDDWSGFHLDSYRKPPEAGFRTREGLVTMTIGRLSDDGWQRLMRDLGFNPQSDAKKMQLLRDIGNPDTSPRGWESRPVWEEAFAHLRSEEVVEILERNGAGGFPMTDYTNVFQHPQVKLLEVLCEVTMSNGAMLTVLRSPWRLAQTPMRIERGPPLLGEHTQDVLAELNALKALELS